MRQHPFNTDRAGTRTDIPKQFAAAWRQRGQGHSPDFAFGDLPVMFEQAIVKSVRKGQDTCALIRNNVNCHDIQSIDVLNGEIARREAARSFPFSSQSLEQSEFRPAETGGRQQFCDQNRVTLVRRQRYDAGAGMEMRPQKVDGSAVQ